jgi:hypothetical protein
MESSSFEPSSAPPPPGHQQQPEPSQPAAPGPTAPGHQQPPPASPQQPQPPPAPVPPQQPGVSGPRAASEQVERLLATAERVAADVRANAEAHAQRELEDARRHIDQMTRERVAMLSELAETMIQHATVVATQCESLLHKLEATMRRLGGTVGPAPAPAAPHHASPTQAQPAIGAAWPPPGAPAPAAVPPPPQAAPAASTPYPGAHAPPAPPAQTPAGYPPPPPPPTPAAAPQAPVPGATEEAYLRATRLALDGYDRTAIAHALRAEFGIRDPEPMLDRVFGGG